jgi:hypothetical protein
MILSNEQAEHHLKGAVERANRGRMTRLMTHPWKVLYPRLLRTVGLSHPTSTKTFWTGRFEVALPEAVSTRIWRYGFFESDVRTFFGPRAQVAIEPAHRRRVEPPQHPVEIVNRRRGDGRAGATTAGGRQARRHETASPGTCATSRTTCPAPIKRWKRARWTLL